MQIHLSSSQEIERNRECIENASSIIEEFNHRLRDGEREDLESRVDESGVADTS